ncbi:hypothetical protein BJ508DRAFT_326825 [Ascobolus immersus RN42]|uniref:Nephrocystin 3-like N-terminal domain-containing protein n=1 Tax=Ascobolus immersus RN42 TaxID=1160509 RepID=A0A3N4I683_ASCIM|nr:hypothetical protein BJ508DRAFT_326825 [Ascobolus immersus RN42]
MMGDALAIIGLLSNIAQFLEYGIQISREAAAISDDKSETTKELCELATVMQMVNFGIEKTERDRSTGSSFTSDHMFGNFDEDARLVVEQCKPLVKELSTLIENLQERSGTKSRLADLALALRRRRAKSDLENLEFRIRRLLEAITRNNISVLRNQQAEMLEMLHKLVPKPDIHPRYALGALNAPLLQSTSDDTTAKMLLHWWNIKKDMLEEQAQVGVADITATESTISRLSFLENTSPSKILELETVAHNVRMIQSLQYPEDILRQSEIKDAYSETFEWVFNQPKNPPQDEEPKSDLHGWLKNRRGISGYAARQAGSGKSTMVKWLCEHPSTKAALEEWAGERKLMVASHYFWISGFPIQRSLVGLYRGILCQILAQDGTLASRLPSLAARRQQSGQNFDFEKHKKQTQWTIKELEAILMEIASHYSGMTAPVIPIDSPQTVVCLFIDGLDEYDSRKEDDSIVQKI